MPAFRLSTASAWTWWIHTAALFSMAPAAAQVASVNSHPGGNFATMIVSTGDVNGDGVSDLLVGAFNEWWYDRPQAGRAYLHDGRTGRVLLALRSPTATRGGAFGVAVASVGDVDGDGVPDLAIGAPTETSGGRAYVFSATDGRLLTTLVPNQGASVFGHALAAAGDVDLDGVADVLVGDYKQAVEFSQVGTASVVSGATGRVLLQLMPPDKEPGLHFGRAVAGGVDLTGDGVPDWIVAARNETVQGLRAGRVHLFDGSTRALVGSLQSPAPTSGGQFGLSLAVCPDLDGDGRPDLVIGAGRESGTFAEEGRAYVFSGATRTLLYALSSPTPSAGAWFGQSVTCMDDVNADGIAEIAVGAAAEPAGAWASGAVHVFDGATGQRLAHVTSPTPATSGRFGISLAPVNGGVEDGGAPRLAIAAFGEAAPAGGAGSGVLHLKPVHPGPATATPGPDPAGTRVGPVSPNPARRTVAVTVTLQEPEPIRIWIIDALGRVVGTHEERVAARGATTFVLDTARLAPGSYQLRVRLAGAQEVRPFILAR